MNFDIEIDQLETLVIFFYYLFNVLANKGVSIWYFLVNQLMCYGVALIYDIK